tara:strand:+ start:300 stop:440 length:141 start_codon:yes stop_codon:yes gene_type:complete
MHQSLVGAKGKDVCHTEKKTGAQKRFFWGGKLVLLQCHLDNDAMIW